MLSILLALAPPALAGAGLNFTPGVEGQQGFGAPVVSPSGQYVAITAWNRVGLSVLDLRSGRLERVSGARGPGGAREHQPGPSVGVCIIAALCRRTAPRIVKQSMQRCCHEM